MKQLAQYHVRFESRSLRASVALMGVAILAQAVYFFVLRSIQEVAAGEMTLFLIIPMVLELAWVVLLHSVKLDTARVYGIFGSVFCVLLVIQLCMTGTVFHIILGMIAYLLGIGAMVMITWGFFPYKYFGVALFALILCVRLLCFDTGRFFRQGDWQGFILELAGLSTVAAMMLFFNAISASRKSE